MGSKIARPRAHAGRRRPDHPGTTEPVGRPLTWFASATSSAGRSRSRHPRAAAARASRSCASPARPSGRSSRHAARARRTSRTRPSTSSGTWRIRATSRCRSSPTRTATSSISASATARSSAATRSSSRRRRHLRSTTSCGRGSATIAVDAARAVGYRSAGTIEGLLSSRDGEYFFLEMNTRIQVEHTVTELVTGVDLVREQVLIAAGEPLWLRQEDVRLHRARDRVPDQRRGSVHGDSCPRRGGSRATGSRRGRACASTPGWPPARRSAGVYDPMVAKLCVHGVDREHARRRMLRALDEYEIGGVDDAPRLPSRAARAPVLRRWRDVPRHRRVGGAGRAGG